jgi:hypothetical protein
VITVLQNHTIFLRLKLSHFAKVVFSKDGA